GGGPGHFRPSTLPRSHSCTPLTPTASFLPSGEKTSALMLPLVSESIRARRSPVTASQRRTVPSKLAEASSLPSGENATAVTSLTCRQTARTSFFLRSHSSI